MDSMKNFFGKFKKDSKFKKAGAGKSLSSSDTSRHVGARSGGPPAPRQDPSVGAQRAGQAALDRFSSNTRNTQVNWSVQAIKAQARRELEAEKRLQDMGTEATAAATAQPSVVHMEAAAVQHVMFSSPLLGNEIGQFDDIKAGIKGVLLSQLEEDQVVAACLIIHTCNKGPDKVKVCCDTLSKYMANIVDQPEEDKYRKIRQSNKAYQERVQGIQGAQELLTGAGFKEELLPFNDTEEKFWVFPPDGDVAQLCDARESLSISEPVRPVLERSPVVLLPQQSNRQPQLPPEFFTISKEEIQKEMQIRAEVVEQSMILRTKAMRERQNQRDLRKYRFTFVRVRFNDGLTLQGTFRISEKLSAVKEFIREYLINDWRPFWLSPSGGKKFGPEDDDRSLAELYLVPASLMIFQWDGDISDISLDDLQLLGPAAYELIQQLDPQ